MHLVEITERQKRILECIVSEYVESAHPISSQVLEKKYHLGVSGATLRNEMLTLSRMGFLEKPFASSGRVPTDKGYRFFVDETLEKPQKHSKRELYPLESNWHLAKKLASLSSSLVAIYSKEQEMILKEGWEDLLEEPEFEDQSSIKSFAKLIADFEKNIADFDFEEGIQIFIGKEIPFSRVKDFSIMIAECEFSENEKGIVAFLGPKRMEYPKNINILHEWTTLLKN